MDNVPPDRFDIVIGGFAYVKGCVAVAGAIVRNAVS